MCTCLRAWACALVGFLRRGGTAVPPLAPPPGSCSPWVSSSQLPERPPCPPTPLSLARWLCGHPHPAERRRGPARAARDSRAAPGPVRVSCAMSFRDEELLALKRFSLARRLVLGHVDAAGLRTQRQRPSPVVGTPGQTRRAGFSLGHLGAFDLGRGTLAKCCGRTGGEGRGTLTGALKHLLRSLRARR
ncbi:unnamed protein product [Rangifer tarandus platyrhynchus]|uniref:Uncharacterized protein n=2 Tax=Rangifer tarandus platyrhynchus TaxID=3082113 RepID=A0ACB0ECI5_RANTA|nr:unnamed protein product [Rangifer tarandus platyrhynchus]CAI9698172.1 unnamed protein product [Rangifer tarandus platyrhynchus]